MPALYDEEDPSQIPSPYPPPAAPSPYDTIAPEQSVSALGQDYGGGEDQPQPQVPLSAIRMLVERGTRTPAPAGSGRAILQDLVRQRLAERERQPAAPTQVTYGGFDANALANQFDPNGPELQLDVPPQEKPQEEAGWGQIFSRGLLRANEAVAQDKDLAEGKKPRASKTPTAEFEQPLELGDFTSPVTAAKKLWYGLAKSYPAVAASVAGSVAGGAAGTAVGGPVGGTIGGLVGGAAGMGGGSFLMEIGPAYQAERETFGEGITPEQDQQAWDKAWNKSLIAGGVGAASMGFFGLGKPISNALKSLLTPVVEGAEKAVAGIPLRAAVQTVGQPAISVGGQVTENAVEGKPLGTNLNQAVAGGLANVVPDVAAALGGRVARRVLGGRQGEVTPGVTDEQRLALDAAAGQTPPKTTPAGPGGTPLGPEPTPARPTPPPFEAPPAPPGTGPGGMPLGEGPAGPGGAGMPPRPPGGGPGGTPMGPEPIPGAPVYPVGPTPAGVGGTPLGPEPTPAPPPVPPRPTGGPGGMPLEPEPVPVRPTEVPPEPPTPPPPGAGPGGMPLGPEVMPPPRPAGPTPPGIGGTPLGPEPTPAGTPIEPLPPRRTPPGPGGTPLPEEMRQATHVEPDDVNPGQSVAKNAAGDVIGKGASPEEALADARARRGEPYAEEVPAEEAKPAEAGTKEQPVSETPPAAEGVPFMLTAAMKRELAGLGHTPEQIRDMTPVQANEILKAARTEKAPPAEAAKPEPAASGRDAASETPKEQTLAEAVKAKGEARQAAKKKPLNLEAKGRADAKAGVYEPPAGGGVSRKQAYDYAWEAELAGDVPAAQRRAVAEQRLAERVTKTAESSAQKPTPKSEAVTEGTRTKSGAYVSPGEAADVQAPRPAAKTQSDLQAEVAADAAKARKKGLVSEATRRMAEVPMPEEPFHVPDNLNTVRKAQRIIQHILNGMPIADAVKAFGAKAERTVGRPRNVESLSSFIREELRTTKTGAADAARDMEMAKAAAKLRKLGPEPVPGEVSPERRAILDELDERLKLSEGVRANRAKLEDALAQAEAIERGEPAPTREVRDVPRSPMAQIVEYMALRPEVNEPVLRATETRGSKFSGILDTIENNRAIRQLIPQYAELARVLRRILPDDVDVVKSNDIRYAGYNPNTGKIEVNAAGLREVGDRLGAATAMLHEGIHVATDSYITRLYRTPEELLTPRELAHKTALEAIRAELQRISERASEYDRDVLELAQRLYEGEAPHELATYILTQPEIMGILAGTRASVELKTALNNVGLGLSRSASIWDGFKRIVRSILGLSERSDSVLDHVLRPLTDIVETGGRYRREEVLRARREVQVTNNEVLGGSAQTRDVISMRRLREAARDVADRGIIKTAMRGAFQSATTTAIRDFIKGDVPSAVSHFEYLRQITHASEQERVRPVTTHGPNGEERTEPNIDKARRLHQELKTGPDAAEVNKLMTEVTQAEMSVIDPSRNAHLVTDVQRRQQEAFQARFDALDPAAKQTYREVNEYHNEIYRAEREAKVKNLVDIAFGDRSEADKQAIREQMRTKQGVLDVLNSPDATPAAKVLGRDWGNKKDLVRLIAESQEGGFVDGDYFPSRRHGEYVVSAGEHNKPGYLVQMFETQSSAQAFRDQLIQSGRKDVSQVFVKSRSRPRDLVSVAALSTLDKAMERAGLSGDAAEVMRDMYAGIMIQHGTRLAERTMRREGIAGASVDQARNILGDFLAYTSRIGHLMHGADAARTLYQSEAEARALHKAGSGASEQRVANAQLGVEELRNRMSPGDGDRSADWMGTGTRRLTTLTVLNTLLRPAHFFMQLAGTHAASTSLIAARHGYLSSVGAVNRAYAQLAGTAGGAFKTNAMASMRQELRAANWDLADMYRRRLSRANSGIAPDHADLLIDRLNQAGLINHTWIREIQRLAGPQGFGDSKFNFISRFLDVSSAGEHAIDSMMRVGTAKAAFELEFRKNGGHLNDALDYAMQMAERSQPDYTMHNKARIATVQGSLGRLAPLTTQFRQFGLHMYGVQGNLLAEGVRGARGSAERAEAFKSIAYLQASHALIWSGVGTAVFGSLPMMAGLGLYDLLFDPAHRPRTNQEAETASRNWVRDITGSKTAADIFAHGVPMAFGLNVSRSLQFTNLLSPPELKSFDKPGMLSFLAQAITGASGDTAAGMVEGMGRIFDGDISKETIAKLLPRIVRDPLEAVVWGEQGLKTAKGDLTIVPPEKFSTADLIAKGMGFIPETSSTAREARAAINLRELTHRDITGGIIDRLVKAAPDEKKAVMAEITRYNASVDPADRITGQQIQSRLREQARINAMPGQFGMRVPRREYGKTAEITRFAQ